MTKEDARGGGDTPFTREEIYAKFDSLVGTRLDESTTEQFRESILDVESAASVGTLFDPLR